MWCCFCFPKKKTLIPTRNAKIIITYNTKLGKERHKEGLTGSDWKYTDPIDIDDISYEIEDLGGNTDYLFKVGFTTEGSLKEAKKDKEKMIWSTEAKCKTERGWGIAKLLILIGHSSVPHNFFQRFQFPVVKQFLPEW